MSIIDDALEVINTHNYKICELCNSVSSPKRDCKQYCLPVEMFVKLLNEKDGNEKLTMLDNSKHLFEDKESDK